MKHNAFAKLNANESTPAELPPELAELADGIEQGSTNMRNPKRRLTTPVIPGAELKGVRRLGEQEPEPATVSPKEETTVESEPRKTLAEVNVAATYIANREHAKGIKPNAKRWAAEIGCSERTVRKTETYRRALAEWKRPKTVGLPAAEIADMDAELERLVNEQKADDREFQRRD